MKKQIIALLIFILLLMATTPIVFAEGDEIQLAENETTNQNENSAGTQMNGTVNDVSQSDEILQIESELNNERSEIAELNNDSQSLTDNTDYYISGILDGIDTQDDIPIYFEEPFLIDRSGVLRYCSEDLLSDPNVVIPSKIAGIEVREIGKGAFLDNSKISSVTIPNSVTHIGSFAFCGCTSLNTVNIAEGTQYIDDYAFEGVTNIKFIFIPKSVKRIGKGAFEGCAGLQSIEISRGVQELDDLAFFKCSKLTVVTIPESVVTLGQRVFQNCENLGTIIFMGNAPKVANQQLGDHLASNYTTFYFSDARGFTNPWCSYPSQMIDDNGLPIIRGDLMRKGKPTLGSFSLLGKYLLKKATLDDYQMKAADMNGDGKVTIKDFSMLGNKLLRGR